MNLSGEESVTQKLFGNRPISYLFDTYYARLCYFSFTLINEKEDSKDIVQEVFLKLWNGSNQFESEIAIKNFLYLSVRNACLNYQRHALIQIKYTKTQPENTVDPGHGLENIIKAELIAEIQTAINSLPEGCGNVLKLAFLEGLKNDDISKKLGISINTVKTQKQRALKLLKLKLSGISYLLLVSILP
ncbi:MAG: RNA polymerase sigma-70 factor [Bacteroidetes bacterium]|nr:RNA polymerase sigma-70 factor [Bacteroidota bacterium]